MSRVSPSPSDTIFHKGGTQLPLIITTQDQSPGRSGSRNGNCILSKPQLLTAWVLYTYRSLLTSRGDVSAPGRCYMTAGLKLWASASLIIVISASCLTYIKQQANQEIGYMKRSLLSIWGFVGDTQTVHIQIFPRPHHTHNHHTHVMPPGGPAERQTPGVSLGLPDIHYTSSAHGNMAESIAPLERKSDSPSCSRTPYGGCLLFQQKPHGLLGGI